MRRIAFLRSIEIQQTKPYLTSLESRFEREGIEAKLFYTDGDCGPDDFPGTAEKLPGDISPAELAKKVIDWSADGVVSLSIADENALRDAVVKRILEPVGIPMVGHSLAAVHVGSNKWETKGLLRDHGFDIPGGILVDSDVLAGRGLRIPAYVDSILMQASDLGYPLISKPLWDCMGVGMVAISDESELQEHLARPHDGNFILEQCVSGEICSVEVVGARGSYVVQPRVWQGPAEAGPVFNFGRLRYAAPRPGHDEAFAPVAEKLQALCRALDLEGAIGIDMIYQDGRYKILEINPRVTGTTTPASPRPASTPTTVCCRSWTAAGPRPGCRPWHPSGRCACSSRSTTRHRSSSATPAASWTSSAPRPSPSTVCGTPTSSSPAHSRTGPNCPRSSPRCGGGTGSPPRRSWRRSRGPWGPPCPT